MEKELLETNAGADKMEMVGLIFTKTQLSLIVAIAGSQGKTVQKWAEDVLMREVRQEAKDLEDSLDQDNQESILNPDQQPPDGNVMMPTGL